MSLYRAKLMICDLLVLNGLASRVRGDKLVDAIAKLSAFFYIEEYLDSRSSSTMLVYFSRVLGFSPLGLTFERL